MKSFSERLGYVRPVVVDDAPLWLRAAFTNAVLSEFLHRDRGHKSSWRTDSIAVIGTPDLIELIGLRTQLEPDQSYLRSTESRTVLAGLLRAISWEQFYEAVEVVFSILRKETPSLATLYQKKVNEAFVDGNVAWQMNASGELTRTLPPDIVVLESALQATNGLGDPAKLHLRKARKFLDEKPCDSTNAVKESISAIESFVRSQPDGSNTLGQTLNVWKRNGRAIPALLIAAIEKLYGFANSEAGVRHGNPKEESLVRQDAEFVYLTTLATLRYLEAIE